MKRSRHLVFFLCVVTAAMVSAVIQSSPAQPVGSFKVTNLLGSVGTKAPHKKDPHMINAWGNAFLPGGNPFWINDQGTGVSELIDGKGIISKALPFVKVPGVSANDKGQPTGIVGNISADFAIAGGPALFIFDTEEGTISGWNLSTGASAAIIVNNSATASYTGLAIAQKNGANRLYAANFGTTGHAGSIDVFDAAFNPITVPGGFVDQNLPANFEPYNIANVDGTHLLVAYAKGLQPVGQVDEFDVDGNLIMSFTSATLAAPWGMVIAPANFGAFASDLLVGNVADGTISAFNPANGEFLGQLADSKSRKIIIPGLWSLVVGGDAMNAKPDGIYFTAGPMGYAAGLFGVIEAGPVKKPKPTRTPRPTRTARPKNTPADPSATRTPMYPIY